MPYEVIFDLSKEGYRQWWFPALGLVFVALGILFIQFRDLLPMYGPARLRRQLPRIWLGFAISWTVLSFGMTYSEYRHLRNALASGGAKITEGPVTNLIPMPYEGHVQESFFVGGHRFAYSDYDVSAGFNNTSSHGGPIREGLRVRITHVGDVIVRREVAK